VRLNAGVRIAYEPRDGFFSGARRRGGFHQDNGRSAIVDPRSVTRGHGAVFLQEYRLELCHVFKLYIAARMLIGVEDGDSLAGLEFNADDLLLEATLLDSPACPLMTLDSQRVLSFTGNTPLFGNVFSGDPHMHRLEGVGERSHHHVDCGAVPHPGAPAFGRKQVGATAHALRTSSNGHIGVAEKDRLRSTYDRLQTRSAEPIHIHGWGVLVQTPLDCCDPRQVHVPGLGVDHMAEGEVANFSGVDPGSCEGLVDNFGGELGRRNVLEAASKSANGGADGSDHDNVSVHA